MPLASKTEYSPIIQLYKYNSIQKIRAFEGKCMTAGLHEYRLEDVMSSKLSLKLGPRKEDLYDCNHSLMRYKYKFNFLQLFHHD